MFRRVFCFFRIAISDLVSGLSIPNRPDRASTLNGQALAHLIQYQNGCFHAGVSASIFARRRSVLG